MQPIYNPNGVKTEEDYSVEIEPGEEILVSRSFKLRTDSPVACVFYLSLDDDTSVPAVAKVAEVK